MWESISQLFKLGLDVGKDVYHGSLLNETKNKDRRISQLEARVRDLERQLEIAEEKLRQKNKELGHEKTWSKE